MFLLCLRAGMAELADAADLKSAGPKGLWGFESPSRHQSFNNFSSAARQAQEAGVGHHVLNHGFSACPEPRAYRVHP